MTYELILQPKADQHLDAHIRAGNKQLLKKIYTLFEELKQHPQTGTGKPEKLKHRQTGLWSRRIDDKHRFTSPNHYDIRISFKRYPHLVKAPQDHLLKS